jgi:hypothetical protein
MVKAASIAWPFSITQTILFVVFDLCMFALAGLAIIYW